MSSSHCRYACSLWISSRIMEFWSEEKSCITKSGVWRSILMDCLGATNSVMEGGSIYRQNKLSLTFFSNKVTWYREDWLTCTQIPALFICCVILEVTLPLWASFKWGKSSCPMQCDLITLWCFMCHRSSIHSNVDHKDSTETFYFHRSMFMRLKSLPPAYLLNKAFLGGCSTTWATLPALK
jgi:hypothetical protein